MIQAGFFFPDTSACNVLSVRTECLTKQVLWPSLCATVTLPSTMCDPRMWPCCFAVQPPVADGGFASSDDSTSS